MAPTTEGAVGASTKTSIASLLTELQRAAGKLHSSLTSGVVHMQRPCIISLSLEGMKDLLWHLGHMTSSSWVLHPVLSYTQEPEVWHDRGRKTEASPPVTVAFPHFSTSRPLIFFFRLTTPLMLNTWILWLLTSPDSSIYFLCSSWTDHRDECWE